ncbi:MAG: family 16 glycosylhydrolase [Saprospiraceae bacterium]|nr:family 16 glycosylhydrolase [Saprospiraceae bacterium]
MKYILGCIFLLQFHSLGAQCPKLIWSDEFDGTELNKDKWSFQLGDGCDINLCQWGNNELQWYTSSKENLEVSDGTLKLIARKQNVQNRSYTSARIRSLQKGDFKFGRIEARMRLPVGQGIWPAFWMLPTDNVYGDWPQSGELDIMEYLGHEPNTVHGTLHYGNSWPNNASTTKDFTNTLTGFDQDFHVFAIEWSINTIKWFVDGYLYSTKSTNDLNGLRWPFDQKFHILLNLAVGGNWPGNPNSSTAFPQIFEIDYVRVYEDLDQPSIAGVTSIKAGDRQTYQILNLPTNAKVDWIVPPLVKILSGQGTDHLQVEWGSGPGRIMVNLTTDCIQSKLLQLEISIKPELSRSIILENFDQSPRIKKISSTGMLSRDIPNPGTNSINASNLCGKYVRSATQQYDVLAYDIEDIKSAADFISSTSKFYLDLYTDAPIGTQVLLQLENKNQALPANYPIGRHSRYMVTTTKQNEWERLAFHFLDKPGNTVSDFGVNQLILLFASNSFTGHTYYFDNFDIYTLSNTVGIQSIDIPKALKIFPNPIVDQLSLNWDSNETLLSAQLYDTTGKQIRNVFPRAKRLYTWTLADLSKGSYIIKLIFDDGSHFSSKIIKD